MRQIEDYFTGCAGVKIFWQAWLPDATPKPEGLPKAVVVVAHGFGEHSGRYQNLVDALVPSGYAIYAPDHRGHGRSEGHRALIDKHTYLLDDLDRVFARAATDYPGLPVFLLGHSMGGNIALASALAHQDRLAGLILSGPAVTTHGIPKALQTLARTLGKIAAEGRDPKALVGWRVERSRRGGGLRRRSVGLSRKDASRHCKRAYYYVIGVSETAPLASHTAIGCPWIGRQTGVR